MTDTKPNPHCCIGEVRFKNGPTVRLHDFSLQRKREAERIVKKMRNFVDDVHDNAGEDLAGFALIAWERGGAVHSAYSISRETPFVHYTTLPDFAFAVMQDRIASSD